MVITLNDPAVLMIRAFEEAAQPLIWLSPAGSDSTSVQKPAFRLRMQAFIDFGIMAFKLIQDVDVSWHRAMFQELIPYHEADRERIVDLYRAWDETTKKVLAQLKKLEKANLVFDHIDILELGRREVKGMLTSDDEFFEGTELDELVEDALAAHARGETTEMREIGD